MAFPEKTERNKKIVTLYKTGKYTMRDLAERFNLDVKNIWLIINRAKKRGESLSTD